MPSSTSKYAVPYPLAADTVASLQSTIQNLANRLDLLLGESGTISQTGTNGSQAVVLSRTYPGNVSAAVPGIVILNDTLSISNPTTHWFWISTWTGTATTITGFTIGWNWSTSQSGRVVTWRFIPCL